MLNAGINLLTMFTAKKDDFFAVESKTDNHSFLKVHNINAISIHSTLNSQGNIVVNTRLDQSAKIVSVDPIDKKYHPNITPMLHRDNETSSKLGIRTNDVNYKGNIVSLRKVIEIMKYL